MRRRIIFAIMPLLLLLLLCCTIAQAQQRVYKWQDDQGQTRYSEIPPTNRPYEIIRSQPPAEDPEATLRDLQDRVKAIDEERGASRTQQSSNRSREAHRTQQCEQAQSNLEILTDDRDVVVIDSEGNKVLLDDQEREANLQQTRKDIEYFCDN